MNRKKSVIPVERVEETIMLIRGQKVILDSDLAKLYGVSTKRLNEQVRRNVDRFPEDFMFQLSAQENHNLRSQFATSNGQAGLEQPSIIRVRGGRRYLPYAFTEHGAIMAANVLNSPRAVQMSVFVVRAFVRMRSMMNDKRELARRLSMLEKELKERLDVHESAIVSILQRIMDIIDPPNWPGPPRKTIGFEIKEAPAAHIVQGKKKTSSRK